MIIDKFIAGILFTLAVEIVLLFVAAFIRSRRKK